MDEGKSQIMITLEIAAPEFVQRFQSGEIPSDARVTVTFEPPRVADSPDNRDEAEPLGGEELEAERRLYEQFESGVNANRTAAETRTL